MVKKEPLVLQCRLQLTNGAMQKIVKTHKLLHGTNEFLFNSRNSLAAQAFRSSVLPIPNLPVFRETMWLFSFSKGTASSSRSFRPIWNDWNASENSFTLQIFREWKIIIRLLYLHEYIKIMVGSC